MRDQGANGINAITIKDEDELLEAKLTTGNSQILLAVKSGKAIRFEEAKMLRKFEDNMDMLLEDIKAAFVFKENKFFGVCVYSFEREAVSTAISLEGPVSVVGA